jgi:hypothetical protein
MLWRAFEWLSRIVGFSQNLPDLDPGMCKFQCSGELLSGCLQALLADLAKNDADTYVSMLWRAFEWLSQAALLRLPLTTPSRSVSMLWRAFEWLSPAIRDGDDEAAFCLGKGFNALASF